MYYKPMESPIAQARRLDVSVKTLQRWEREGRLIPMARTAGRDRAARDQDTDPCAPRPADALWVRVVCALREIERL